MKLFRDILKRNAPALLLWGLLTAANICVFALYDILIEPLVYSCAISFFFLAVLLTVQYVRAKRKAEARALAIAGAVTGRDALPAPDTLAEEDYQQLIDKLCARINELSAAYEEERQDAVDYYTSWVHQIKTPIAVMKLKLTEDTPEGRALGAELFRIEQYADMVLQYIRLGSGTNDLVIREYRLDELIRETVRKFAPQFIEKKLRFEFEPSGQTVITDKKWFMCILEQLISNAVKYTPAGSVSVTVSPGSLTVADTGIGIAAEDLPRIFEKGFTGNNGRLGEKSSGLGLYLAGKAADLLLIRLSAQSAPGQGSRFTVAWQQKQ